MDYHKKLILNYLKNILTIPSPTGFTNHITNYLKKELDTIGIEYKITNKGSIIITLEGEDKSFERTLSAHMDTLGAMVKDINDNGTLSIVPLGGFMMNSIEGENCSIHTLNDEVYSGTIQTIKPSVHIHGKEAYDLKRSPENMEVILDEKIFSKKGVENLNINIGDFISFDTRNIFTENGFIKSRHLDDKASLAILLYAIKYIHVNNLPLSCTTNFLFSNYEEVGHGASFIPKNTKEFIAVDMGAPGENQNSSEYSVCICAKDSTGPYDLDFRKKLINICKTSNIPYKIDIYPSYGSDASAALKAGFDIKAALIGPGVYASHAYERTHMDSILATLDLIIKYCVS
ncbi:M42 family metallopeptidase [Clostridium botulinum]|uniref:M42 family metallopeptidase n=1 Tax=Clostridium botulinum TaxID=1491 RepID=UPI001C9A66C6|nr:M42 family metallopeptidase [Clostridium botulinum]MBY6876841.1 M42 family metallopeptidase [Clostridium botulinum]